jgi:transcriptional regulator with XRE-family HTH domain
MAKSDDVLVRFGKRVREMRAAQGYSQEGFAHACGLDRTYVGGIERGERNIALRNIALRNIEQIAVTLGLRIDQLMKGV